MTAGEKMRTLVDPTGYFYTFQDMEPFLAQVGLDELEAEWRAQIESVLALGLQPTHLDWHSLRIGGRPDIAGLMFRLAREYGLALRVMGQRAIEMVQSQGLPANDHDLLDSYGLDPATKPATYARLLHELPAGLSEWAVHPALDTAEFLAIEPGPHRTRQADYDFLVSQAAKDLVRSEGIILLDYRAIQAVWNAT